MGCLLVAVACILPFNVNSLLFVFAPYLEERVVRRLSSKTKNATVCVFNFGGILD